MDSYTRSKLGHLVAGAVIAVAAAASTHIYHESKDHSWPMPNPKLTPGAVLTTSKEEICEKGHAGKVRHVTQSEKEAVYKAYGILSHKPGEYEIDHLISLEIGGSNDPKNLWPEPYHGEGNAHLKDALENKLHQMICEGLITPEEAQREILNWPEAYEKYISN
jgi:hypothetical protein